MYERQAILPAEGFPNGLYCSDTVGFSKYCIARYKSIGTIRNHYRRGLGIYAAIDLNPDIRSDNFPYLSDFFCRLRHKFLPAKARMNRHHQDHIAKRRDIPDRLYRRFRIQAYPRSTTELVQFINQSRRVQPDGLNLISLQSMPVITMSGHGRLLHTRSVINSRIHGNGRWIRHSMLSFPEAFPGQRLTDQWSRYFREMRLLPKLM